MKIKDIITVLDRFAAPELQEDYDNAGLITGSNSWECKGVLCSLDCTPEIIEEAIARNCNLVVAHHPIIFKGLKSFTGNDYVQKAIITALKNDIAIFACHTNLDNVLLGVNGRIAEKLGLKDIAVLMPKNRMLRRLITFAPVDKAEGVRKAVFDAGAGHIGKYSECSFNSQGMGTFKAGVGANPFVGEIGKRHEEKETKIEIVFPFYLEAQIVKALVENHPYEEVAYDIFTMDNVHFGMGAGIIGVLERPLTEEEFLENLASAFNLAVIRHTRLSGRRVQRVALCGGAGAFLIKKALGAGADAYVTADVKYHEFFDANDRMLLADIGHYESEQYTVDLLCDLILQKFPTFAVLKTGLNTNPVKYFTGKA